LKITLDRQHALKRLQRVAPLALNRGNEILRNICVIATDEITAQATDTEVFCLTKLDGEVHKPGAVLLPKDRVIPFLSECTDDFVTFETLVNSVQITCGKADVKIPTGNPDEFPKMRQSDEGSVVKVDAEAFAGMIKRTGYATDPASSRFALGGILLHTEGDSLFAIGTDGRRLSMMEEPCQGSLPNDWSTIVPKKALSILEKVTGSEVSIWRNSSTLFYRDDSTLLSVMLVEGRFPNWKAVIPNVQDHSTIPISNPSALQSAVRQAAIVTAGSETRGIRFTLDSGVLRLSCIVADAGKSVVEVPIEYDGVKREVMLDHDFLRQFLDTIGDDSLVLHIGSSNNPVLCEAGTQRYVIMPLAME
jgi:DNA polymerase III subunit beta